MIQIVGKDDSLLKQCTCKNCTSILKYSESSVQTTTLSDYTGDKDSVKYIKCPECSHNVFIK